MGVLALLEAFESTRSLPLPVKSAAGSMAAGLWRIGLTPIDAYKTTLQVLLYRVLCYNRALALYRSIAKKKQLCYCLCSSYTRLTDRFRALGPLCMADENPFLFCVDG